MRCIFSLIIGSVLLVLSANINIYSQNIPPDVPLLKDYLDKARTFSVKNELDSAIYYDKLAMYIYAAQKDTSQFVRIINFIAKLYQKKFTFDSAFAYIQNGLKLFHTNHSKPPKEKGDLYNSLGTYYYNLGDYANASIHYKQGLKIREQYYDPTEKELGDSYTNLGNVQFNLGHLDDASNYYQKALNQRLSQKSPNIVMIAKNYSNLGYTFLQKGDIINAKKYFLKGFQYAPLAVLYQNLGEIFTLEKNYFSADTSLKKALDIRIARLGSKHYLTAQTYVHMAELEKARGNFNKSLEQYSEGLKNSIKSDEQNFFNNPDANLFDIISIKEFFLSLNGKAEMLLETAKKDSTKFRLLNAKKLLDFCNPLISSVQNYYKIDDSKLNLRKITDQTMNLGIEVCYELYKISGDKNFASSSYIFSEKKRNAVLRESKRQRDALTALHIPDSIKARESALKFKLRALFVSSENSTDENDNKETEKDNLIASTVNAYDSLITYITQQYPKFSIMISETSVPSPEVLQNNCAKEDMIVEYTVTEKNIFIFSITGRSFSIIKKEKHNLFNNYVKDYKNGLKKIDKQLYRSSAKALYKELILPIQQQIGEYKNITIIPCPELVTVPFEAFLTPDGLPLVYNKSIFYCGTSGSYLKENKPAAYSYDFLGFAPSYSEDKEDDLAPLKNEKEITEISKIIKQSGHSSRIFSGAVSKESFLNFAGKGRILHLAAHSFADTVIGVSSGIFFPKKGNNKTEVLRGSEIISAELNNDLVVLSSCEGGYGKTINGEGVLSLARYFLKAGANNMIVALWNVPDTQTKIFMTEFYRQLIKDYNYANALSRTKRIMYKSSKNSFPNTWAAFVLMK